MNPAPDYEGPVGSMPQAAEQHGQHQIPIGIPPAVPVSAERYIKVVPQPGAQADMPTAPEILKTGRKYGWRKFTMK